MNKKLHLLTVLFFVFATTTVFAQIPNSGFENWTSFGSYMEANGWNSANTVSAGSFYPATQAADPYPTTIGNYSIRLENNPSLLPAWEAFGFAWNAPITGGPQPSFPITGHPNSLTGYYKWLPQNGDTMFINVTLYQGGSSVSWGVMSTTVAAANWTSFNIPFSGYTSADSAIIMLSAFYANGPFNLPYGNSVLYVDNLNFDTLVTTRISEDNKASWISVYPNPFSTLTTIQTKDLLKNATLTVYNCFGQEVKQIKNISGQTIIFSRNNFASGLYFFRLTQDNKTIAIDKLIITDKGQN